MKKFLITLLFIIIIVSVVLFYRFETRKFLNFSIDDISISQAKESDFRNVSLKDNENENPLNYFDIVFNIKVKNTSENLRTENIVPYIILPKELKPNDYIDIGLNPLCDTDEIILPGCEKEFPYKIFVKKEKNSELLKILKESKFKVSISSLKNSKFSVLSFGNSIEYVQ